MSLVICSNQLDQQGGNSQSQSPFSWSNHLDTPFTIPPNSEVAVQSCKINKDGSISASPSNRWFMYVGNLLSRTDTNYDLVSSAPFATNLDLQSIRDFTTEDMAKRIQDGLNRGMACPDMWGQGVVVPKRGADGLDFTGFDFETNCSTSASLLNPLLTTGFSIDNYIRRLNSIPQSFGIINKGLKANREFTAFGKGETQYAGGTMNVGILKDLPMALNHGEFIIDVSSATSSSYGIGLTRSCELAEYPQVYNEYSNKLPQGQRDFLFSDFYLSINQDTERGAGQQRRLRVFHAVGKDRDWDNPGYSRRSRSTLNMEEIEYWTTGSNSYFSDLTAPYNMSTNASAITKFKFVIKNENVLAYVGYDDPTRWEKLIDSDIDTIIPKALQFKPLTESTRALYPLLYMRDSEASGVKKWLKVDQLSAYDKKVNGKTFTYGTNDWYSANLRLKNKTLIRDVDTRPFLNYTTTATTDPPSYFKMGINASDVLDNSTAMILKPSTQYTFTNTPYPMAGALFGFPNVSEVVYNIFNLLGQGVLSTTTPRLKTNTSLFIRLNNFNVDSYNAGRSNKSSILYTIPRFASGTNESVGALFYESPERVYLSLNNPNEITAQSFNIDIVNEDESMARDLMGKSVVVLHFRKAR